MARRGVAAACGVALGGGILAAWRLINGVMAWRNKWRNS